MLLQRPCRYLCKGKFTHAYCRYIQTSNTPRSANSINEIQSPQKHGLDTAHCDNVAPLSHHEQISINLYDNIEQLLGTTPRSTSYLVARQNFAIFPHSSKLNPQTYGYDPIDGSFHPLASTLSNLSQGRSEPTTLTLTSSDIRKVKGIHDIRSLLRRSFRECTSARDILRMLAICMQRDNVIREFMKLPHVLYSALYRARDHSSDLRIAGLSLTIIQRLEKRGCPAEEWMLQLCLKFAARGRNLVIMERALQNWRKSGFKMTSTLFRSIIAKFSIGRRGWGEIRNGRWKRNELLQVLFGFHDSNSNSKSNSSTSLRDSDPVPPYHLQLALNREDWHYLHGWIMLLARLRAIPEIQKEWSIWLHSSSRKSGALHHRSWPLSERQRIYRRRGDKWFIRHMLIAGDASKAWTMLEESQLDFLELSPPVRNVLLEYLEFMPARFWNQDMRMDLLRKWEEDLAMIESRLGVRWVAGSELGDGWHITEANLPETFEELSRDDYFRVYGYITDSETAEEDVFSVGDRLGKPMISDCDGST